MSEGETLLWIHIGLEESYPGPTVGKCIKGFSSVCVCVCENLKGEEENNMHLVLEVFRQSCKQTHP